MTRIAEIISSQAKFLMESTDPQLAAFGRALDAVLPKYTDYIMKNKEEGFAVTGPATINVMVNMITMILTFQVKPEEHSNVGKMLMTELEGALVQAISGESMTVIAAMVSPSGDGAEVMPIPPSTRQ